MAVELVFNNGRISNFEGLVTLTLTLTLDFDIRHTFVHRSSTSTYKPNIIEIDETFCGRTHARTDILRPALLDRLCRRVDLKCVKYNGLMFSPIMKIKLTKRTYIGRKPVDFSFGSGLLVVERQRMWFSASQQQLYPILIRGCASG